MNLKEEPLPTPPATLKKTKTLSIKEDVVDIKMIGAAGIIFQQEKNLYFLSSIKQINELLSWHNQHPDFAESISAIGKF